MSGTVDIRRVLLAVMAAATLAVVLAVPQAQAANDCSAAGTDPTAAQYCPPTEPKEKECTEGEDKNGDGKVVGSECTESQNECAEGVDSNGDGKLTGSECQEAASSPTPPAGTVSEGGTLPFTGTDVIALLAIAAAFIAVGLALQRLSKTGIEQS